MSATESRVPPLNSPYEAAVQASFDKIMPPGVPPLRLFRTVAHNPRVLQRMIDGGLLDRGTLSIAERELIILRTCALCGAEYEWGVHVAGFSHKTKFTPQQIANSMAPTIETSLWNETESALLLMVEQLHEMNQIDDALWQRLYSFYSHAQLVELVMLTGLYHAVSFVINAFKIQPEEYAPRFSHFNHSDSA